MTRRAANRGDLTWVTCSPVRAHDYTHERRESGERVALTAITATPEPSRVALGATDPGTKAFRSIGEADHPSKGNIDIPEHFALPMACRSMSSYSLRADSAGR